MPWEVIIPPEQEPLYNALAGLGLPKLQILKALSRLTEPPESLSLPDPERTETANDLLNTLVEFDGDAAARMLRVSEGQHDSKATWRGLTSAERKRAKRLWSRGLDAGLDTVAQGRPSKVDGALVLYCMRVLAEVCGHSRFKFSRPTDGGAPRGPMWRALMIALPLAASYLASVEGLLRSPSEIVWDSETVADLVTVARSKRFANLIEEWNLGLRSGDVARQPSTFRLALSLARRFRPLRPRR
jgi:hypothetical protein